MQITFFSFVMSLLWFNVYIIIINMFRKNDNFIIYFSTFPLVFFLFLCILRLVLNFEISSSIVIKSRNIFPKTYDFIRKSLYLKGFSIDIFQILILIWVTVAIILLINNIIEYIIFKKNLGKLNESRNKENEQAFNEILCLKEMNKRVKIIQHYNITSPFLLGILEAEIYIPNIDFSQEELEYIISHELNHFIGKDSLKKILIQSIRYIFWWNPLVHLFANNFNHILEMQCDLKTTAKFSSEEKVKYLESITKIINNTTISSMKYNSMPHLLDIEDIDSLKQRFRIVLNYKHKRNLFKLFNIALCFLVLCLYISSYFIIIQPYYEPSNNEIYKEKEKDNSFIIEKSTGSYDVYINNTFKYSINNLEDLKESLSGLPIYKERVDKDG